MQGAHVLEVDMEEVQQQLSLTTLVNSRSVIHDVIIPIPMLIKAGRLAS